MKRTANYNIILNAAEQLEKSCVLEVFRRLCLSRYFELGICEAVKSKCLMERVYLSLGQESIAAALSMVVPDYQIFAQHRCHATYLAFGGDPEKLRDELLGLPTGVSQGRGGSNCLQCHQPNLTMYGHHGLIGENVPIGVGAALGNRRETICFFGDGAAEEDYVFSSLGFAATHKLPVFFVCEDNDLSILTKVKVRRSWELAAVTEAFGLPALEMTDDPWTLILKARELTKTLPAFINVYTCRARWHAGIGIDNEPEWHRFNIVKQQIAQLEWQSEAKEIEMNIKEQMFQLWHVKHLQKLLKKLPVGI